MHEYNTFMTYACAADWSLVAITVRRETIKLNTFLAISDAPINTMPVQLREIHLNFENYGEVIKTFEDADCDTFLNVRQTPGFFFILYKTSTSAASVITLLIKSIEIVAVSQLTCNF